MTKNHKSYFKVITSEGESSADLLLYGVIGQDFWWDEELKQENLTDLAVVQQIDELSKKYNRINMRINSPGGMVFHGHAIITAMLRSSADIHTYVDGLAASMAADIWAAGNVRHMSITSKLMIHSVSSFAVGTAQDMREEAGRLDKFDEVAIATFAKNTGMTEEEVKERFYDYKDHWLTAKDALEIGLIDQVDDYEENDAPADVEQMSYHDLIRHFSDQKDEQSKGMLQQLKERFFAGFSRSEKTAHLITQNIPEMNIEEFKTSLGSDLAVDDVVQHLREEGYTVTKRQPAPVDEPTYVAKAIQDGIMAATAPLQQQITTLQQQITQLGNAPGANPTDVAASADAPSGVNSNQSVDYIQVLADAADNKERVDTLS